jgi:tetratricopeptide (TPR) repeat protein
MMVASGWEICANAINLGQNRELIDVAAKCIAMLENAHREADYFGRPFNTYCAFLGAQGVSLAILGHFTEGAEACEKGLRFACGIDNRYTLAMSETDCGDFYVIKGDGKRAVEHLREALRHSEATQFALYTCLTCQGLGLAHSYLWEMEEGRLHLERAIKIGTEGDISTNRSAAYFCLGIVHFFSGDLVSAQRCAEEGIRLAQQYAERAYEGYSWIVLGAVLSVADPSQSARAEECLLKGIAIEEEVDAKAFSCCGHFFLGQAYDLSGQRDKAVEHLTTALSMFQEMGMDFWLTLAESSLSSMSE